MTLPSHINTREKEKFEELNDGSIAIRAIDRGFIFPLLSSSGILTGTTCDSIVAERVSDSVINYLFYDGLTVDTTITFTYTSDADWSIVKS